MSPRKGRRIAIASVVAVVGLIGTLAWLARDHIRFFLAFESLGPNAQYYAEFRHRQTGIVFVSLPGGTFEMGSPEDEEGRSDHEGPVHEVTLSPFMISKYEVTQAQWESVTGERPTSITARNLPVNAVSWDDCRRFCDKTGLSMPSEAQWEYACRARTSGAFAGDGDVDEMAWHDGNRSNVMPSIGGKSPNGFGLHDMHGSVWEWSEDVYDPEFFRSPSAHVTDPVCRSEPTPTGGFEGSATQVMRGGSWLTDSSNCRSAARGRNWAANQSAGVGFRPTWFWPNRRRSD